MQGSKCIVVSQTGRSWMKLCVSVALGCPGTLHPDGPRLPHLNLMRGSRRGRPHPVSLSLSLSRSVMLVLRMWVLALSLWTLFWCSGNITGLCNALYDGRVIMECLIVCVLLRRIFYFICRLCRRLREGFWIIEAHYTVTYFEFVILIGWQMLIFFNCILQLSMQMCRSFYLSISLMVPNVQQFIPGKTDRVWETKKLKSKAW